MGRDYHGSNCAVVVVVVVVGEEPVSIVAIQRTLGALARDGDDVLPACWTRLKVRTYGVEERGRSARDICTWGAAYRYTLVDPMVKGNLT